MFYDEEAAASDQQAADSLLRTPLGPHTRPGSLSLVYQDTAD